MKHRPLNGMFRALGGMRGRLIAGLAALAAVLPAALPGTAAAAELPLAAAIPLPTRNLSPVTQLLGLPRALGPLAPAPLEASLVVLHANNFAADVGDASVVVFDGSTTVTSLALRGTWGARGEWGLDLPYVNHDGGFTDGFIEGYHDLFGFPNGGRDAAPRERLDYRLAVGGRQYLAVTDREHGPGDVGMQIGYALVQTASRQVVVRGRVELPTGDDDALTGSGGTDASVWVEMVEAEWLRAANVTVTLAGGVTLPGDTDLVPGERDAVATGHIGFHYPLTGQVTLRAQLDGHTDTVAGDLEPLGRGALLGTLGGSIRLSPSVRLDLGLVEDLTPDRAPDVVSTTALSVRF